MHHPHFAARVAAAAALVLFLQGPHAAAQRGGRGGRGGGMERGGGAGGMQRGGGAGGMQRGGGMERGGGAGGMQRGGGMERGGGAGGTQRGGGFSGGIPQHGPPASMGPYGHAGGQQRPPGAPQRPGSYPGARPEGGAGTRPGVGVGGVGGPESGVGVRPGMGAGRPGMGGPDSGVGVRPGMGAGAPGMAGERYGTRYVHNDVAVAQADAVRVDASRYPAYNPAMYGRYPTAWNAGNLVAGSYYANPGYAAMSGMLGMGATPMPYDYGGNVVAQPTAVYINGDAAGTPEQYAQQAGQIAAAGQSTPADPNAPHQPAQDEWLPIGVFAMIEGDQTNSNDIFQLAVNKQGQIRGNYHNLQADSVDPVSGAVDPKKQRVAWTIGGDQTPVYEAGVSNLLQDHAPMLVHTPDGQQKQFTLVRLADPGAPGGGSAGAPAGSGR